MYKLFYNLDVNPFEINPNPEFFFESKTHMKALDDLNDFLKENDPFIIVKGDFGVGKTHMKVFFSKVLGNFSDIKVVTVNPVRTNSYHLFLSYVLKSLNVEFSEKESEDALQSKLNDIIENNKYQKDKIIFMIDDTQDILFSVNLLRFLSDLALESFAMVQFILFAHNSFLQKLDSYPALKQRIRRIISINPMDFNDTKEYIYFRLYKSGANKFPYFTDESIKLIHSVSEGRPRIINTIAYHCLLIGAKYEIKVIEPQVVKKALETLEYPIISSSEDKKIKQKVDEIINTPDKYKLNITENKNIYKDDDFQKNDENIIRPNQINDHINNAKDKYKFMYNLVFLTVLIAIGLSVFFVWTKVYKVQ